MIVRFKNSFHTYEIHVFNRYLGHKTNENSGDKDGTRPVLPNLIHINMTIIIFKRQLVL